LARSILPSPRFLAPILDVVDFTASDVFCSLLATIVLALAVFAFPLPSCFPVSSAAIFGLGSGADFCRPVGITSVWVKLALIFLFCFPASKSRPSGSSTLARPTPSRNSTPQRRPRTPLKRPRRSGSTSAKGRARQSSRLSPSRSSAAALSGAASSRSSMSISWRVGAGARLARGGVRQTVSGYDPSASPSSKLFDELRPEIASLL
jgi:hypothetical protein